MIIKISIIECSCCQKQFISEFFKKTTECGNENFRLEPCCELAVWQSCLRYQLTSLNINIPSCHLLFKSDGSLIFHFAFQSRNDCWHQCPSCRASCNRAFSLSVYCKIIHSPHFYSTSSPLLHSIHF